MRHVFLVLSLALFQTVAFAEGKWIVEKSKVDNVAVECVRDQDTSLPSLNWHACINTTLGSKSEDVLWYFHGGYDNETAWTEGRYSYVPRTLREGFTPENAPRVVVVSFGGDQVMMVKGIQRTYMFNQDHLEEFFDTVVPAIEARLGQKNGDRLGMGVSMGGFNLIQAMTFKPDWFKRVVIGYPIIPTVCSPFDSQQVARSRIDEEIKRREALGIGKPWDNMCISGTNSLIKQYFGEVQWEAAFAEMMEAKSERDIEKLPAMYVEVGERDEMGYFKGTCSWFKANAQCSGSKNILVTNKGGHAQLDGVRAAEFLLGLPTKPTAASTTQPSGKSIEREIPEFNPMGGN